MDMTGMMPGPDGTSAVPLTPAPLGDGDVLGDGIQGPETPENVKDPAQQQMKGMEAGIESELRNRLVTEAYGTKLPQRRAVDKS